MDKILRDIRNFFKKLESGQLEIEAGQWELHKDVCKIKRLFEELKKLKDNVEEMRLTNVKQMSIIKSLEKKLESFRNRFKEKDREESEKNSCECEDDIRDSDSGCDTKKPRIICSEEIIEITSRTNSNPTTKKNCEQEETNSEDTEKNNSNTGPMCREYNSERKQRSCRKTCNEMLQRYLNDSAKYSKKRLANPSGKSYCCNKPQQNECFKDAGAWDNYSGRLPQGPICKSSDRSYDQDDSSDSCESVEPVMPTSISCARCPKNCMIKPDFFRHGRYKSFQNQRPNHYSPFKKGFETLELFRAPKETLQEGSSNTKNRRCGYCSKICYTPEMLSSHVNKCRLLMKSRFNWY